ncbi:FecR domain-containing protein [Kordia sp. YSTF-M3]|uniref:FecR domain-containing protein n=1 Tax=Kordia aestuariivivens TaxID=2759037 RepID=A0ABR7QAN5_9FLAO|nr:FecR domain-containing protein [Kordia aestuariivivens]MBC8755374.1 FecR domain-containing protein [Kordia aestuariivivens]
MMEEKYDDTFLARWLADDLNAEEKMRFENSAEYQDYLQIIESADQLEAPSFDKQVMLKSIQEKQQTTASKTRKLNTSWMYAAAAVVLLFVGLSYVYLNSGETFETGYGNQLTVTLPDGSEAILNSKSSLTFNEKSWDDDRTVALDGEAYFKVKKGEKFTVTTSSGTIEVLGTQFNVLTDTDMLEVKCHEGKVKVSSKTQKTAILTQGNAFSFIEGKTASWNFDIHNSTWREGESNFREMPLKHVITALQDQYEVQFIIEDIDTAERFTGSFSHTNLKLALRTVFVPMEISYTFKDKKTVILKKAK